MRTGENQATEPETGDAGEASSASGGRRSILRVIVRATLALVTLLIIAAILIPGYCGYPVRAKVQEGLNLSSPLRTSLAIACNDGGMHESITHEDLGLAAPDEYSGRFVHSVRVEGVDASTSRVVVVMKEIASGSRPAVRDGDTVVYTGVCVDQEVQWSVDGTIADKYKPVV